MKSLFGKTRGMGRLWGGEMHKMLDGLDYWARVKVLAQEFADYQEDLHEVPSKYREVVLRQFKGDFSDIIHRTKIVIKGIPVPAFVSLPAEGLNTQEKVYKRTDVVARDEPSQLWEWWTYRDEMEVRRRANFDVEQDNIEALARLLTTGIAA